MTGYGQGSAEADGLRVSVELRSVNNRFADLRIRIPGELGAAETVMRRKVFGRVRRGRVELSVKLERIDVTEARPSVNRPLLEEVLRAAEVLHDEFDLTGELDRNAILGIPGLFRAEAPEVEWGEAELGTLERALDDGLEALDRDRVREGETLRQDLLERVRRMKSLTDECRNRAGQVPAMVRDRLLDRLRTLGADVQLDPARVAQEAAVLADRSDVTEELVRLEGHLEQGNALLSGSDDRPVGKRLDFLLQEIQRETNTVCNKSVDLELTRGALELKVEVEKVREQVQNLE